MSVRFALAAPLAALLLIGCTAMDVVTLPVKVAKTGVDAVGAGVDAVTTSQAEADQKRGREVRRREEKLGKLQNKYDKLSARCIRGDHDACTQQSMVRAEIDLLMPTVPYEAE